MRRAPSAIVGEEVDDWAWRILLAVPKRPRRPRRPATGRDTRGRKQYRYYPRWREARNETKFGRMVAFAAPSRAKGASRKGLDADERAVLQLLALAS